MFDDEMAAALKRFTEKNAMKYELVHYFRIGLSGRAIAFGPKQN